MIDAIAEAKITAVPARFPKIGSPRSQIADRAADTFTLSKLRVGDRARVVGLLNPSETALAGADQAESIASCVAALGLTLGQTIEVVGRGADGPSWTLDFGDGRARDVRHDLADLVLVKLEPRKNG